MKDERKEERDEELDRRALAMAWLAKRYNLSPFPKVEWAIAPLAFAKDAEGRGCFLEGTYRATDTITLFGEKLALEGLFHEVIHAIDARQGTGSHKDTTVATGLDPEGEAEVQKRAKRSGKDANETNRVAL